MSNLGTHCPQFGYPQHIVNTCPSCPLMGRMFLLEEINLHLSLSKVNIAHSPELRVNSLGRSDEFGRIRNLHVEEHNTINVVLALLFRLLFVEFGVGSLTHGLCPPSYERYISILDGISIVFTPFPPINIFSLSFV